MLERRMKQLEDSFNTNTKVFSDGIQMLEAQNEVLRRALRDTAMHCVRIVPEDCREPQPLLQAAMVKTDCPRIDFNAYLKEYIQELADKEAAEEERAKAPTILVDSDAEQPTIFGGG